MFDTSDRDPAKTASALQRLDDTLRRLFVEGWIMVDLSRLPGGDSAASKFQACENHKKTICSEDRVVEAPLLLFTTVMGLIYGYYHYLSDY